MTNPQQFYERSQAWIDRLMELNPGAATQLGDHRFDGELGDFTLAAQDAQNLEFKGIQAELAEMETGDWPNDARVDHTLMTQIIKSFVRGHERLRGHVRNPGQYIDATTGSVMILIMKEFAPLPERLKFALERTRQVPRVLREAKETLVPSEVPRVWAETAIEQGQMASMLFTALLPSLAQGAAPDLVGEITEAGAEAGKAIEDYVEFLRNDLLPKALADFAVGKELFDEILREDHMVDYDADELIETGWEQFELTKRLMEEVAKEIDPAKSVEELLEEAKADHPTAEGLLQAYEVSMAGATQFVIDNDIATIPDGETLRIIETPVYMRPLIPYAAYMPPGIFEEQQDGIFVVTPVDPSAPAEAQEQKLKGHFNVKLPVVALHEAYPGHHLQLVWANRAETIPRRMGSFLSTLFIEGWAFYCEELMEQLGWIAKPIQRLGRLHDQLWRAGRIILDVSLHTRGMTVQEGIDFMVEKVQLEPANATAEVRRYTQTPTQPQSYLMGKLQILELVEDFKKANPDASLREVHDTMLAAGSLPPRLMRQALGL
ncbi:MAG: DUF885 domain-containing protein [Candidatus Bipolaricaulia bacterium]